MMWLLSLVRTVVHCVIGFFFFQAEDGIRDLVRSRGLGDVYKRQERHGIRYHRLDREDTLAFC